MGLFDFLKKKEPAAVRDPRIALWLEKLSHADPEQRREACDSLGKLGRDGAEAVPALEEALMDDDNQVCEAAARAVNDIRRSL